jgi:hypothetical protein
MPALGSVGRSGRVEHHLSCFPGPTNGLPFELISMPYFHRLMVGKPRISGHAILLRNGAKLGHRVQRGIWSISRSAARHIEDRAGVELASFTA